MYVIQKHKGRYVLTHHSYDLTPFSFHQTYYVAYTQPVSVRWSVISETVTWRAMEKKS
jgi:hypothetical protein